jgi:hypothetical protein
MPTERLTEPTNPAAKGDRHRLQVMRHPYGIATDDTITVFSANHADQYDGVRVVSASFHLSIEQARKLRDDLTYLLGEDA